MEKYKKAIINSEDYMRSMLLGMNGAILIGI